MERAMRARANRACVHMCVRERTEKLQRKDNVGVWCNARARRKVVAKELAVAPPQSRRSPHGRLSPPLRLRLPPVRAAPAAPPVGRRRQTAAAPTTPPHRRRRRRQPRRRRHRHRPDCWRRRVALAQVRLCSAHTHTHTHIHMSSNCPAYPFFALGSIGRRHHKSKHPLVSVARRP